MLDITLLTGRKNQIRVQFADIFRQVVGDKKYGSITVKYQRLCLHSYCLSFTHPYTKKPVSYTTTIPEFIKVLIGDLDGLQLVEEIKQD
jgi:23S rRNA-/tRNA-specific pseudouridylate synthase